MEEQEQEELKTLVHALCLVSRNLPLPASTLDQLHSILSKDKIADSPSIHDNGFAPPAVESVAENLPPSDASQEENEVYMLGGLLSKYEEVIAKRQLAFSSSASLRMEREYRLENKMASRQSDIEFMECSLDGDLYQNFFMEKQAHKLAALQKKIRRDIAAEFYLQQKCSSPDMCLFDWGLLRLARTSSAFFGGLHGDAVSLGLSTIEADERICRKREAERQRRLEEEEHSRVAERKKKFFNDLLNFVREFQLQVQAAVKRRRQRNDGVQGWHAKQRQRATRAERLRFQALKADDQEAYMRMVEESKNERLTTLLEKTDELLQRLGAMVQIQKEAAKAETQKKERPKEKMKEDGSHFSSPTQCQQDIVNSSHNKAKNKTASDDDQREDVGHEEDGSFRRRDLLEGQRQYNSLVHSIEEKVTEQPAMLIGGQLRPYQLEGLQWMLSLYNNNLNGILADEMGLGKTIQTIALLAYLIEKKGLSGPHLIIAPKAVLPNWAQEFIAWAPSMVAVYYDGRLDERKILREQYKDGNFNVLITHYDLIMRDKAFLRKVEWDYMIVDEGHRLKNHDCILSQTLTTGYQIRRRLLLTGTPIQNSLQELWALLNFLLPAIFNSCQNFEEWFSAPFADPSVVSLTEEEQLLVIHRLHQVIRPFLLRRKKSEVEKFLPSKTQVILKCDMSAWQRAYYQQITESGRVGLASGSGKSRGLQNTAMQLRKCCNHPYLFLEGGDYNTHRLDGIIRSSGKFELLDRILPKLQKSGHRVLLFSQMTRLMDILGNFLMLKGIKYLRLDGTTKTEERSLLLKQFNAPDSPFFIFLLSTRAGGLGLNLQTADTVILFDSDWNPQMDQQAEDRAHRIGQKREVRVFVLVSVGSIEEEILERAKSKMGIDEKVIQAGLFNTTSTAQERREMLEEIMRRGTDALGTDVPSEREINRVVARNEEEFRLFERMDAERRKKEGYRSRLIEEHEIPDWVFLLPESKNMQTDIYANLQAAGKRKRKEVIYTDAVSDSQWEKAVEEGEDVTELEGVHLSKRHKKRDQTSLDAEQSLGGNDNLEVSSAELDISYSNNGDTALYPSYDRIHESDTYEDNEDLMNSADVEEKQPMKRIQTLKFKHPKKLFWAEEKVRSSTNYEDGSSFSEQDQVARWKGLRKKRTSHAHLSSEDSTFSGEKSRAYFEYY